VRIEFDATVVDASRGEEVLLGRDPEYSPQHAEFFGTYPTVSRRHAILRLDDDGRAWIRDCYSSNLTRVNGEPLPAGKERELRTGDQVRLCAQLAGMVTLIREVPDVV
jgi:pSer/pThr/pTyr-binding forkhead associated (FHA) protein